MQLFVQGQSTYALDVKQEMRVGDVKEILSDLESVPCEEQVLYYGGLPLEDDSFVCDSVPENGTLSLTVRLLGGNCWTVHSK